MYVKQTVLLTLIVLIGHSASRCDTQRIGNINKRPSTKCVLPEQPENGSYILEDGTIPRPGAFISEGSSLKYSCKDYYFLFLGSNVTCVKGNWTNSPECLYIGDSSNTFSPSVVGGHFARVKEFPWHVGIYLKSTSKNKQPTQVCGGTLINKQTVITAAHCFYTGGELRKEIFSVAGNKLYRKWNDKKDSDAQYSEIRELHIPEVYEDVHGNYADDIAVLILETPFSLKNHIRAVQVDWTHTGLEVLQPGTLGTVPGWGLTEEDGSPSPELKYVSLPAVPRKICKENSPQDFGKYLTHDKFCAGYLNGSSVCKGDSGGGFIVKIPKGDSFTYHLRGVVSVGPSKGSSCDSHKFTAFTSILKHLEWLKYLVQKERITTPDKDTSDFVFPE